MNRDFPPLIKSHSPKSYQVTKDEGEERVTSTRPTHSPNTPPLSAGQSWSVLARVTKKQQQRPGCRQGEFIYRTKRTGEVTSHPSNLQRKADSARSSEGRGPRWQLERAQSLHTHYPQQATEALWRHKPTINLTSYVESSPTKGLWKQRKPSHTSGHIQQTGITPQTQNHTAYLRGSKYRKLSCQAKTALIH